MADVRPFRGVRYNMEKVDGNRVIAPPYDIISGGMRLELAASDLHNVVRLELPDADDRDDGPKDAYDSARRYLDEWLGSGVLRQDDEPAFYLVSQEFDYRGDHVRWGLLAAVGIEEYEKKIVLPHEGTMDGPKEDRYRLMEATRSNLSPIFMCYFDGEKVFESIRNNHAYEAPIIDVKDHDNVRIKVWRIAGRVDTERITGTFSDKKLYIADGHHRYETCMAFRNAMREKHPGENDANWNRTLMYLVDFDDPGLIIRPYHRAIKHLKGMDRNEFMRSLDRRFHVRRLEIDPWGRDDENRERAADELLEASARGPAFAVICREDDSAHLLQPRVEALERLHDVPGPLQRLDATILQKLVLEETLEISEADLRAGKLILYDPDYRVIWRAVRGGEWAAAFFMCPVKPIQVGDIAEAGLKMPIKSTYFYPKIPSGLVFHRF